MRSRPKLVVGWREAAGNNKLGRSAAGGVARAQSGARNERSVRATSAFTCAVRRVAVQRSCWLSFVHHLVDNYRGVASQLGVCPIFHVFEFPLGRGKEEIVVFLTEARRSLGSGKGYIVREICVLRTSVRGMAFCFLRKRATAVAPPYCLVTVTRMNWRFWVSLAMGVLEVAVTFS